MITKQKQVKFNVKNFAKLKKDKLKTILKNERITR